MYWCLIIPVLIIVCMFSTAYSWLKHPEDLFGDDEHDDKK